jgi:hypothetical protein
MDNHPLYLILLILLGLLLICAPAAAQASSHTTIQVYTDETVLGRIVSITPASDIGAYAITITRGTSVQPAMVGDTLRHKDIITIQRGSFADIQLVDRSDKTMLGGGTGGTAILLERAGAMPGQEPVVTQAPATKGEVELLEFEREEGIVDIGRITFVQGKAYIQRSARIIPAIVGEGLLIDDTVFADEGAEVTLQLETYGSKTVKDGGRLILAEKVVQKPEGLLDPVFTFFGGIWTKVKDAIGNVEALIPTATAGVRG